MFYKCGHHGSHNATLKTGGLEEMTSGELVAMIPVEKVAVDRKKWRMPSDGIRKRLLEITRGRTLRADEGKSQMPAARTASQALSPWDAEAHARWTIFDANVMEAPTTIPAKTRPLYTEYVIPLSD